MKYHFVRESVDNGLINVDVVRREEQLSDILMKALGRVKFHELHAKIGLLNVNTSSVLKKK